MHIHTSEISVSCIAEGHPMLPLPMVLKGVCGGACLMGTAMQSLPVPRAA